MCSVCYKQPYVCQLFELMVQHSVSKKNAEIRGTLSPYFHGFEASEFVTIQYWFIFRLDYLTGVDRGSLNSFFGWLADN